MRLLPILLLLPGVLLGGVCDEDIALDDDRRYCLVFSAADDRPANATADAGVTWDAWGPVGRQLMLIRWMTVADGWEDPDLTPHETNAPWPRCAWSSKGYDDALLGLNRPGLLGAYHPVVHVMRRETFEGLGDRPLGKLAGRVVWE